MKQTLRIAFGGHAQVVVGISFFIATVLQTAYWFFIAYPPGAVAIFAVSMEALGFAAYAIIATGLGYVATERVESIVMETVQGLSEASDVEEIDVPIKKDE